MNNQEAKFILGAYRPDGRDAQDSRFAEAIAQAERDPELRAWWDNQRAFDATVAAKLRDVAPPPGLRESILAGGRASQPRRRWWSQPGWLAAAAAVALLATLTVALREFRSVPNLEQLATFAVKDLDHAHDDHSGYPANLAAVQGQLASAPGPLTEGIKLDLEELRRKNCRTVRVAGREVFEVCFQRDGTWFHLYAARRSDFAPGPADPKALLAARGKYAATAWSDGTHVYALVARAGVEALRRVI
jgi:hypothetical protein